MLLKEESSCGGLFDSGTVGVCPSVRPYVRTHGHTITREGWQVWLSYTATVGSHVEDVE